MCDVAYTRVLLAEKAGSLGGLLQFGGELALHFGLLAFLRKGLHGPQVVHDILGLSKIDLLQ